MRFTSENIGGLHVSPVSSTIGAVVELSLGDGEDYNYAALDRRDAEYLIEVLREIIE